MDQLTTRSQEALSAAVRRAAVGGHPEVAPIHLLRALLDQPEGIGRRAARRRRRGARRGLRDEADAGLRRDPGRPGLHGGRAADLPPAPAGPLGRAASAPETSATRTSRPSTWWWRWPRSTGRRRRCCARPGATADALLAAFPSVRGSARVTSPDPEATYQALEKYGVDLTARGPRGQARPGDRPRRRDPPRRAGAVAAHQEQPGAHRRARRRQDRRRRGAGPADRRRRRAGVAARQAAGRARPRRDGRRREVPRRVRGAAQGRAGGDQGSRRARSSRSSTSCTPSSARAPPASRRWTPATCSSRCWPAASCGMVGATTLDEYREHIEKDPALERRFQQVFVGEPSVEDTIAILRGLKERYEAHHRVEIADAALVAAATLSDRYISGRQLPDKAIDLVDEAASRLRMEIDSSPVEIDELRRAVDRLKMEELALEREDDPASGERLARLRADLADRSEQLSGADRPLGAREVRPEPRRRAQGASSTSCGWQADRAQREGDLAAASRAALRRDPRARARARRGAGGRAAPRPRRWSRTRSGRTTSPRSSPRGPASRPAGCWRARPRSCCGWRTSSAAG